MELHPLFHGWTVPPLQQLTFLGPAILGKVCMLFHGWTPQGQTGFVGPIWGSCTHSLMASLQGLLGWGKGTPSSTVCFLRDRQVLESQAGEATPLYYTTIIL